MAKKVLIVEDDSNIAELLNLYLEKEGFDPQVASIKITIYRLASTAKLVEYLAAAAENGKDVTVLMELRARFDAKPQRPQRACAYPH